MEPSDIFSIVCCFLSLITLITVIFIFLKKPHEKNLSEEDIQKIRLVVNETVAGVSNQLLQQSEMSYRQFKEKTDESLQQIRSSLNELSRNEKQLQIDMNDKLGQFQHDLLKELRDNFERYNLQSDSLLKKVEEANRTEIQQLSGWFVEVNNLLTKNNQATIETLTINLAQIDSKVGKTLDSIRADNNEKLEKIQNVVDEKLQKTLDDRLTTSFKNVLDQIGGVNKAIGEIKGLASDVGSLKNVLANVKTKGIVGEVILGNLIRDILTVNQYDENVATKVGSNDRVEFAIKMPGSQDDDYIYLPVDSKFPTESYQRILKAIDDGDKKAIEEARKQLSNSIRSFAKDISEKYIDEPHTTGFAIMFLPIEGLYAEVINLGLFEEIQRDYKVVITGPSTFAALLNALQMGFRTLVIQKKSADVFKLLGAVKTEFTKFADALEKTQSKVTAANDELDKLVGTRTRAMQRKLRDIDDLPEQETKRLLQLSDEENE